MSNVSRRHRCVPIARELRIFAVASLFAACIFPAAGAAAEAPAATGEAKLSTHAAATFKRRCTACHTFGKGRNVGPDLRGVTERRSREWLTRFIRSSSAVIAAGDPIAAALFSEFKGQRMPDWTDLSEKEIADLLDYLATGGPERKPDDERGAETATAAELGLGSRLFQGAARFEYGAQRCSSCHSVRGHDTTLGGSLGPDLGTACQRYRDNELTALLRRPCFGWDPPPRGDRYLTPRERFALKAFLCGSAVAGASARRPGGGRQPMNPELLFKTGPYVSMASLALGMVLRYLFSGERLATDARAPGGTGSPGRTLLRIGLALLLVGHLAGLLVPRWILIWNALPARLYLLESTAFASGTAALLGWAVLAFRHLARPVRSAAADLADTVFLSLVGVALVAGLLSAAFYRWSSSWGVLTLTPYVLSVLRGEPLFGLASQLPFSVQLHVATALAALAIVPYTRLAPPLFARFRRALIAFEAAGSAAAATVGAFVLDHNPGRFIWPDED